MSAKQWQQGFLIGGLLLIIFWLVSLIWGIAGKAHIAITESQDVKRQYEALESRKAALEENLAALATERGQDAAVRLAFGVARPGEEVIVVIPPTTPTTTMAVPWWRKVLSWF